MDCWIEGFNNVLSASNLVCEFYSLQSDLSEFGIFPESHSLHCVIPELLYFSSSHGSEEIICIIYNLIQISFLVPENLISKIC